MLKKIECYIRQSKLDEVKDALLKTGVEGMSILQVSGFGSRSESQAARSLSFEPRIKLEMVVPEEIVDRVILAIKKLAGLGSVGAGKIFVIPVEDAIRVSTSEAGHHAVT